MKKNKMMRLASSLLVAVLLTSSVISGTFAKYVTSDGASDSARVAKFGVIVDVVSNAFSDSYLNNATEYTENENLETITVQANTAGTKVLAPGTEGTLFTVAITGTPEVDVKVSSVFDLTLNGWKLDETEIYCPIVFTVKDKVGNIIGEEVDCYGMSLEEIEEKLNKLVLTGADGTIYHTNTNLANKDSLTKTVTWSWPYYVDGDRDDKDTKLGNLEAASTDPLNTIEVSLTTTVEQVD